MFVLAIFVPAGGLTWDFFSSSLVRLPVSFSWVNQEDVYQVLTITQTWLWLDDRPIDHQISFFGVACINVLIYAIVSRKQTRDCTSTWNSNKLSFSTYKFYSCQVYTPSHSISITDLKLLTTSIICLQVFFICLCFLIILGPKAWSHLCFAFPFFYSSSSFVDV